MIENIKELRETLDFEKRLYMSSKIIDRYVAVICGDYTYKIWKYVKILRTSEYHFNNGTFRKGKGISGLFHDVAYILCRIVRNSRGQKLGIEIYENNFESGLLLYHCAGGIVINGASKIGKNCKIHGNNCIGNDGKSDLCPIIGDNADIGYGAVIIGNIRLGNNITVAAGAVVVDSFEEDNIVIAGIPAVRIKNK